MIIQIFGTPKCKDSRKAERFFKERRVKIQFIDLRDKGVSPGELRSITQSVPLEELIDTEGRQYRARNLQYMKFDLAEELLEDPRLFKTPIVRQGGRATVRYQPETWLEWLTPE
ncbi:MAG: ArsC family transcriptional regulator [FCB group bacterium]|nr:ArsC family transcriptional regulator [FCB group bacterium]